MHQPRNEEALALLEIDSLPRALRAHDAALKRAPVQIVACAPVSPGHTILILVGEIASVQESLGDAIEVVGCRLVDHLFLPGIHPSVAGALRGETSPLNTEALAIVECRTVSAAVESADAAVKAADVCLGRLHPATGFGGKAFFTLLGPQSYVEAAIEAALEKAGDRATDHEIIPAPHEELASRAFCRPWPLDPADGPLSRSGRE